ncbi:MAG: two-component sensor histidine kinase, partial [Spirochaetales bacterium]|nr:two-component sensor histidine kinase [Spirochaetales bacterium]
MSYRMFHSFRAQLLFNISWVVLILVISSTWILFSTVRLQTLAGETLAGQETIDEACAALETLREPLLEYLSNRSSDA